MLHTQTQRGGAIYGIFMLNIVQVKLPWENNSQPVRLEGVNDKDYFPHVNIAYTIFSIKLLFIT